MQTREKVAVFVAAVGVAYFDHFDAGGVRVGGEGFGDGAPEAGADEAVDDVDFAEGGGEGGGEELFGVGAGFVGEAVDQAGEEGDGFEVGEGAG